MATVSWADIACPICEAAADNPCTSPSGVALPHPHAARVKAAERAAVTPEEKRVESSTPPLYGYTTHGETPHLVSSSDRDRSVCGYKLAWIPDVQPANPPVCKTCTRLLATFGAAYQPPPLEGVCPVCWAQERLEGGRLVPHKQLVVGVAGLRRSDVDCDGAGQLPDGDV